MAFKLNNSPFKSLNDPGTKIGDKIMSKVRERIANKRDAKEAEMNRLREIRDNRLSNMSESTIYSQQRKKYTYLDKKGEEKTAHGYFDIGYKPTPGEKGVETVFQQYNPNASFEAKKDAMKSRRKNSKWIEMRKHLADERKYFKGKDWRGISGRKNAIKNIYGYGKAMYDEGEILGVCDPKKGCSAYK